MHCCINNKQMIKLSTPNYIKVLTNFDAINRVWFKNDHSSKTEKTSSLAMAMFIPTGAVPVHNPCKKYNPANNYNCRFQTEMATKRKNLQTAALSTIPFPTNLYPLSRFSFGWRGRGKGKGQIALQMKIFQDHTTNEGVWAQLATWLPERTKRHINVSIFGINKVGIN